MNAYRNRVVETERMKERKRARVERGAGDVLKEPSGEEEKQHEENIMRDIHIGRREPETANKEQPDKLRKTVRLENSNYIVILNHACVS